MQDEQDLPVDDEGPLTKGSVCKATGMQDCGVPGAFWCKQHIGLMWGAFGEKKKTSSCVFLRLWASGVFMAWL